MRISSHSFWARANCLVVDSCTNCLAPAWVVARTTHWSTFLISAHMGVETVVINRALPLEAGNIRISFIAFLTGAYRLVFNNSTEGMFSTSTGVLTELVDAGVRVATFIIC